MKESTDMPTKVYRWFGPYFKGAMRDVRGRKRVEAVVRNRLTPVERTKGYRRD